MDKGEVHAHARRLVEDYLEDGMEFCVVYEDDSLIQNKTSDDDLRSIHNEADRLLRALIGTFYA